MTRRGTVGRRCQTCAAAAIQDGHRWTCNTGKPGHQVRWIYRLDVSEPGEKRRQEVRTGFARQKDANDALQARIKEVEKGVNLTPSKATVGEFLSDWLGTLELEDLEAATVQWYRSAVLGHIIPKLGDVKLGKLSAQRINQFLAEKKETGRLNGPGGLGPTSLRRLKVTLHKAFEHAIELGLVANNPVDRVKNIKAPKRDVTEIVWSPDDANRFLQASRPDRLHPIWHVAFWTGLRRSELAALQWQDIDLDAATITVRRARVVVTGTTKPIEKGPKTATSYRTVELDDGTVAVLRRWKRAQAEERLKAGPGWVGEWVFTNQIGEPLRPDGLLRTFQRRAKKHGLPPTDIKGLRHAHATAMLKAGVSTKVVQERLGHSSINVTSDIYQSVLPGMQKDAVEKLSKMMGGGG